MANVIREDVVQVRYEVDNGGIDELAKELDEIASITEDLADIDPFKEINNASKNSGISDITKELEDAETEAEKLSGINPFEGMEDADTDIDSITKELQDVEKEAEKLSGIDPFEGMKDSNTGLDDAKKGIDETKEELEKTRKAAKGLGKDFDDVDNKTFDKVKSGLKGLGTVAKTIGTTLVKGLGVATASVGAVVGASVKSFSDNEQLDGGVKKLFGDGTEAYKMVIADANDAFKTAGLGANDYMETVTGFSASLISGLKGDTLAAAKLSNKALKDMSDNANTFGTDMESIQTAYQGFSKQNYTMLDNLKLGYGGTKEEMERLIKDASKLDKTVKANSMSFDNIIKAIHAVQENLNIAGTTEKEAATTIEGSLNMLKSSWSNMLTAFVTGGDSFDQCLANLVDSAKTFGKNVMPAIRGALEGVGYFIEEMAPIIEAELPGFIDTMLPPLIKAGTSLLSGVIKALPTIISTLIKELPGVAKQLGQAVFEAFSIEIPGLANFGKLFSENADKIAKIAPLVLGGVAVFKVMQVGLNKILSFKDTVEQFNSFGEKSGKNKKSEGPLSGLTGIIGSLKSIAKTNTKTVLKGILNLTIILGAMTGLTAIMMAIAPSISKLGDFKAFAKVTGSIAILGIVASGLAILSGIVGNIPVATVALGLANMAIMLGGLTAIYTVLGLVTKLDFDNKKIAELAVTMLAIGAVGSAMAIFAGIVGIIPIPIIALGLAGMAIVLGGLTALIAAFGLLTKVQGFNEFISAGGAILANLFNQIGKIAGALVGGFGESLSASLPAIGSNLAAFAESVSPMFTIFNGVDCSGLSDFFLALAGFSGATALQSLVSVFAGGTDYAKLGSDLTTFAGEVKGFFDAVAEFPKKGFQKGAELFKSLSDIGNVPNTGGIAQWFSGTNDFEALATGLGQLAGDGVASFYNTVSQIDENGFENAKKLFESLSDIGNIPNTGGAAQWFSGENDFSGLTEKMPPFGQAMANFYSAISTITNWDAINTLFDSIQAVENIPDTDDLEDLSTIGSALKDFGSDVAAFFKNMGSSDKVSVLSNLATAIKTIAGNLTTANNGLKTVTASVKTTETATSSMGATFKQVQTAMTSGFKQTQTAAQSCTSTIEKAFSDMSNKVTSTCTKMVSSIKSTFDGAKNTLKSSGQFIIDGLINGLESKRSSLLTEIRSLVNAANSEFDKLQKIGSPSRLWKQKGAWLVEGQIIGMQSKLSDLVDVTSDVADASSPIADSDYGYDTVSTNTYNQNSNVNLNPNFTININGANNNRQMAFEISRAVKQAINDSADSLIRRRPRLTEV